MSETLEALTPRVSTHLHVSNNCCSGRALIDARTNGFRHLSTVPQLVLMSMLYGTG